MCRHWIVIVVTATLKSYNVTLIDFVSYFFDLLLIESTKCMMDTVNELNPIIIISASAMLIIKASPF